MDVVVASYSSLFLSGALSATSPALDHRLVIAHRQGRPFALFALASAHSFLPNLREFTLILRATSSSVRSLNCLVTGSLWGWLVIAHHQAPPTPCSLLLLPETRGRLVIAHHHTLGPTLVTTVLLSVRPRLGLVRACSTSGLNLHCLTRPTS